MQKQDLNGYRTPLDVARRYRLGDIELNTLEIEELASKIVTDSALSTTSINPVQNKVVTSALNNKASIAALQNKQDKLIAGANITIVDNVISSTGGSGGGGTDKVGSIKLWSGTTAPNGYLLCDGTAVSRTTYADLFSIIGTTYGSGDGSTTFNLPNLKGKVVVGLDSSDTEFDTLGETGGEKTHTLTTQEMPSHTHDVKISADYNYNVGVGTGGSLMGTGEYNWVGSSQFINTNTGGGQAHNNLQPYIVLNYIIKATNETPITAVVEDSLASNSTVNAPSIHSINELTKYSTSEQKIGYWIDGKPIYRKVVSYELTQDYAYPECSTGITNAEYIKINSTRYYGTNNRYAKDASALNYYFDRQTGNIVFIEADDNVLKPPLGFYWFIIEYTKTTD